MLVQVKVIANASQDIVLGYENGILKMKCRAVPEKGKANAAVVELLANYFQVPKRAVIIVKGKTSSIKTVEIKGYEGHTALNKG